ncbi:MAG: energy-coupling factor transporter transmembrane component T [Candidatus Theseobacter exili]|nr:energy-coupling factor transporter transmembrane component T [Candidatus Theseobacter exili]
MKPLLFCNRNCFLAAGHPVARFVMLLSLLIHFACGGWGNSFLGLSLDFCLVLTLLAISGLNKKAVLSLFLLIGTFSFFMGLLIWMGWCFNLGKASAVNWIGISVRMGGSVCTAVSITGSSAPGEFGYLLEKIKIPGRQKDRLLMVMHGFTSFMSSFIIIPLALRAGIGGIYSAGTRAAVSIIKGLPLMILHRGIRRGQSLSIALEARGFSGFGPSMFRPSSWKIADVLLCVVSTFILVTGFLK